MIVIVCIDDYGGMMFNNRRQSKDSAIINDIINSIDGEIRMSEYSAEMFPNNEKIKMCERGKVLSEANENDICFVEDENLKPYADSISSLIVYEWNRHYPADFHMNLNLKGWKTKESKEFAGTSHPNLRKEIYICRKD